MPFSKAARSRQQREHRSPGGVAAASALVLLAGGYALRSRLRA